MHYMRVSLCLSTQPVSLHCTLTLAKAQQANYRVSYSKSFGSNKPRLTASDMPSMNDKHSLEGIRTVLSTVRTSGATPLTALTSRQDVSVTLGSAVLLTAVKLSIPPAGTAGSLELSAFSFFSTSLFVFTVSGLSVSVT